MKHILTLTTAIFTAATCLARDFDYDGMTFTVLDETARTCSLTSGSGKSGVVNVGPTASDGADNFTVTAIGKYAFMQNTGITAVTLPNTVTKMDTGVFNKCRSLTSATLPTAISGIADYTFGNCPGLVEIVIPESVTEIGENAFYNCTKLTSVTLPPRLTAVKRHAFYRCTGLTAIRIPAAVTLIGFEAFRGCNAMTGIEVDESNTSYASVDGVLYDKSLEKLVQYPNGKAVSNPVFEIPSSVRTIGESSLAQCRDLTEVIIPGTVTTIEWFAFTGCNGLTSIVIPNSVETIDSYAFCACNKLESVTLPASVKKIGSDAFGINEKLTAIYYDTTSPLDIPADQNSPFDQAEYESTVLYVPGEAIATFRATNPWNNFSNISAFDFSGIESVGTDADMSAPVEVYTVTGAYAGSDTGSLAPGIYIVRQGSKVSKTVIK